MFTGKLSDDVLHTWQMEAEQAGCECVVGGVIMNSRQQAFIQKRAPDRRLFPNSWDIVGGHVEPGETLYAALAREIKEETGWQLTAICDLIHCFDWESEEDGKRICKREFDFIVEVHGNLTHPQIEWDKFTEFCWVDVIELEKLQQHSTNQAMLDLVHKALGMTAVSHVDFAPTASCYDASLGAFPVEKYWHMEYLELCR